jgi:hypothetical protein
MAILALHGIHHGFREALREAAFPNTHVGPAFGGFPTIGYWERRRLAGMNEG